MSSALRVPTGMAGRATAMGKGAIGVAEGLRKKKQLPETTGNGIITDLQCIKRGDMVPHWVTFEPTLSQLAIFGTSLKFLYVFVSYNARGAICRVQ